MSNNKHPCNGYLLVKISFVEPGVHPMKTAVTLLSAALLAAVITPAYAAGIKGSSVSSTLAVTGVSAYASNDFNTSTTIGAGSEFDATTNPTSGTTGTGRNVKTFSFTDTYAANFNGNTQILHISDTCNGGGTATHPCQQDPYAGFTMTFTDSAFLGDWLYPQTSTTGYTYSLVGSTITVTFAGGSNPNDLKLLIGPAPEPSSIALLGTGILALAYFGRRRLFAV